MYVKMYAYIYMYVHVCTYLIYNNNNNNIILYIITKTIVPVTKKNNAKICIHGNLRSTMSTMYN